MAIRFVSRKDNDNGVAAFVQRVEGVAPNPGHTISVAVSGSVLSSFYQETEYYSGRDIYYLTPKRTMSPIEMIFYSFCIRANRYKYNYGRGANRTLNKLLLPDKIPAQFASINIDEFKPTNNRTNDETAPELEIKTWGKFLLSDLFDIERGKGPRLHELDESGQYPFVTSTDKNNGWNGSSPYSVHKGNVITVARNGSVGEAFYQPIPFASTEDVHVFNPKFALNQFIALFIITVIKLEKYKFNYGRKWGLKRMNESLIHLPANNGKPDFDFMECYIKSLPFSESLLEVKTQSVMKVTKHPPIKADKGLSDEELVKKYESGKIDFGKVLEKSVNPVKK